MMEDAIRVARVLISANMTPDQVTEYLPAVSPATHGSAVWGNLDRLSTRCRAAPRVEYQMQIEWSEDSRLDVVEVANRRIAEAGAAALLIDEAYFRPLLAWTEGVAE